MCSKGSKPMDIFGAKWENYLEKIFADWNAKVTDDDVVMIGGDISWAMDLPEALEDIAALCPLKGKKVLIRGNHDYWWKSISKIRNSLPEGFYALQNDCVKCFRDKSGDRKIPNILPACIPDTAAKLRSRKTEAEVPPS